MTSWITSNKVTWPFNLVVKWSRDKWKTLYFYLYEAYGYYIDREIASDEKMLSRVTWPVDHVDILDHMTNKKQFISISTRPVVTKLDRMVTQTVEASNLRVTCSFVQVVTWDNVTNKKRYISTSARPYSTNLDMMITYEKRSLPIMVTWHSSHVTN